MMSFSGHPVCQLGLNLCILLGLFLFFLALAEACAINLLPLGAKSSYNAFKCLISYMVKIKILQNVCLNGLVCIYFECIIWEFWGL